MILKVFSVLDTKVGNFGQPFFEQREASAMRSFRDAVNDGSNPNNMWFKHPEDFQLFNIGEFDTESGMLSGHLPAGLVNASAIKEDFVDVKKNGIEKALVN